MEEDIWYKNLDTGERMRVDEYGNLYAPLIKGVTDESIEAIKLRMRVNAGSGIGAFWDHEQWNSVIVVGDNYEVTPVEEVPQIWREVLV